MQAAIRRALADADDFEIVHEVSVGSHVLPAVRESAPDVVLLDLRMPELDGLSCLERLRKHDPTVAVGLELDVIAAVVIGGASLAGGTGSVAGTLAGAVMMAYLRNRCVVLGWPNWVQEMIVGHIIILAVALDQWRSRRWKLN